MKPRPILAIIAGLFLGAAAAWSVLSWRRPPAPDSAPPPSPASSTTRPVRPGPLDARLVANPSCGADGNVPLGKAISGADGQGVYIFLLPGAALDMPMVELQFLQRSADGALRPMKVHDLGIDGWKDGRRAPAGEGEIASQYTIKAAAFRAGAAPLSVQGDGLWRFGRTYYVWFRARENGRDGTTYESLVTVPADIPRGRIWQVPLLADKPFPTLTKYAFEKPMIKGRISARLPAPAERMEASYYSHKGQEQDRGKVDPDGTFHVDAKEVDGMLRITEKARSGVGWMYIHSVGKREVALPADADLVVKKDEVLSFRVAVPREKITEDVAGLAIKVHVDDVFPMSWQAVDKGAARDRLFADGAVEMSFIPGSYYFTVLYWPRDGGWDSRREEVLGRIAIAPGSKDQVLTLAPLTEEERSRIPAPKPDRTDSPSDGKEAAARATAPAPSSPPAPPKIQAVVETDRMRRERFKQISGRIEGRIPDNGKLMAVYIGEFGAVRAPVGADGTFALPAAGVSGGSLRIQSGEEPWTCWMFIKSVREPKLVLPRDADLVFDSDRFVNFVVRLPEDADLAELGEIMLLIDLDWQFPRSVYYRPKASPDARALQKGSREVEMRFAPGTYYVVATGHPVTWPPSVFGKLIVKEDSEGRTLEPLPLTAEERKLLPPPRAKYLPAPEPDIDAVPVPLD